MYHVLLTMHYVVLRYICDPIGNFEFVILTDRRYRFRCEFRTPIFGDTRGPAPFKL